VGFTYRRVRPSVAAVTPSEEQGEVAGPEL
jgi:hypothetical protein